MSHIDRQNEMRVNFFDNQTEDYDDSSEFEEDEEEGLQREVPPWDMFKSFSSQLKGSSVQDNRFFEITVYMLKMLVYGLLFIVVLCSGVAAKTAILFATSQLRENQLFPYCDYNLEFQGHKYLAEHTQGGRVNWIWCLILIFLVPELIAVLRALGYYLFRRRPNMPKKRNILFLIVIETLHTIGLVLLIFVVMPEVGAVQAVAIFCCLCFIPGLLNLLSRNKGNKKSTDKFLLFILLDVLALVAQFSGIFLWPVIQRDSNDTIRWLFPVALILSSSRWWGNFVSPYSNVGLVRFLSTVKEDLQAGQYIVQGYVSLWRSLVFIIGALLVNIHEGIDVTSFFSPDLTKKYKMKLVPVSGNISYQSVCLNYYSDIIKEGDSCILNATSLTPLYVLAIQAVSAFIMYQACKFAYRTHMHRFGFAFPINLISLMTVCLILTVCTIRNKNVCAFHDMIPDYLFFADSSFNNWSDLFVNWYVWCWPSWLLSQIWITMHLWKTENERLALLERIFFIINYDSLIMEQCLTLNRRTQNENIEKENENAELQNDNLRIEATDINLVDPERIEQDLVLTDLKMASDKYKDRVTRIYACATMWHEEKNEMNQLVGSILRLDKDHCAMRFTQKYYKVRIEDYYELETHIFFDDAFCCMHGCPGPCTHDENETQVNQYVITLVETIQKNMESLCMRASPPTKYPTPYGGRLMWTLPGRTQLVIHLKDKNKIRHRKRWSQVMYMYYLLGYRLMGLPIDVDRKEIIAENTYVLTLDGDIDFRPSAVKVLVDLMKKDRDLGAACGRIHPVGAGPMVWFQKFEYAIGHWLQKSTEHTIGCVLCSPGCFSLFRANALMQHNVMAKYATKSTEPGHYIQYDQGEDRWLCTLILQVGSRVEYSAASDAYTHAPEAFKEFYLQRRRWIPSTIANVLDLLINAKETRKLNNDISWLYVVYQWILIGSTILGPGTIFLMLVGAFVSAFHIDNWTSFCYNLIPISIFVAVCFTCKERIQLLVAEIISAVYGLVMIIVLMGIMLQIAEDGWLAPSSLLFFIVASQFIVTGLLHPQEISCLIFGIIYYITVPSMYMLLIIFSIFNFHNVTWGTRESKKTTIKPAEKQKPSESGNSDLTSTQANKRGSLEFSVANLFKCICCIHTGVSYEEKRLKEIDDSLQRINIRLKSLDSLANIEKTNNTQSSTSINNYTKPHYYTMEETIEEELNEKIELQHVNDKNNRETEVYNDIDDDSDILTQASAISSHARSSFLISPYWLQDERMRMGEVDFLSNFEEEFWKSLIEKYLRPIETDEETQNKITQELMSLRDAYLLKFFMVNGLFVLIVFLMQLNKDTLHLQWPLGMKYNVTFDTDRTEVHVSKEYLRLEPIGCVFIAAFISILAVQFCAMLIHRFDTFSHLLANANLKLFFRNKMGFTSEDNTFEKHADEIAQGLQRATENEMIYELKRTTMISPSGRKTIHELTENVQSSSQKLINFESLFRRKLHNPDLSGLSRHVSTKISKHTFDAFERRRSTFLSAKRRKTEAKKICDIYDETDDRRSSNNRTYYLQGEQSNSNQQYDNPEFRQDDDF